MRLVKDKYDEQFSKASQRVEEEIGSVDYDVYVCVPCRRVQIERYQSVISSYECCPKCEAITLGEETDVLKQSTTRSEGLEKVFHECFACDYKAEFERETSRDFALNTSSTYKNSSSSTGSSNDYKGGGGSFGGGGASGKW